MKHFAYFSTKDFAQREFSNMEITISWDKLKQRAITALYSKKISFQPENFLAIVPALSAGEKPRNLLDKWYEAAERCIKNWDIRSSNSLIAAFPSIVPTWCKEAHKECTQNESGNWVVIFTNNN